MEESVLIYKWQHSGCHVRRIIRIQMNKSKIKFSQLLLISTISNYVNDIDSDHTLYFS